MLYIRVSFPLHLLIVFFDVLTCHGYLWLETLINSIKIVADQSIAGGDIVQVKNRKGYQIISCEGTEFQIQICASA